MHCIILLFQYSFEPSPQPFINQYERGSDVQFLLLSLTLWVRIVASFCYMVHVNNNLQSVIQLLLQWYSHTHGILHVRLHFAERYKHIWDVYVTSSQVTPRGGRRHTVGHVVGGKSPLHHLTVLSLTCLSSILSNTTDRQHTYMYIHCLFTNVNMAANTTGGEHICCRHTMPAHGSSHHGWRIDTMPAHGSSLHSLHSLLRGPISK